MNFMINKELFNTYSKYDIMLIYGKRKNIARR